MNQFMNKSTHDHSARFVGFIFAILGGFMVDYWVFKPLRQAVNRTPQIDLLPSMQLFALSGLVLGVCLLLGGARAGMQLKLLPVTFKKLLLFISLLIALISSVTSVGKYLENKGYESRWLVLGFQERWTLSRQLE